MHSRIPQKDCQTESGISGRQECRETLGIFWRVFFLGWLDDEIDTLPRIVDHRGSRIKMGTQTQEKDIFFAMCYYALKQRSYGCMIHVQYTFFTYVEYIPLQVYIWNIYIHPHTHIYIFCIYIYVWVHMCYSRPQPVPPKQHTSGGWNSLEPPTYA